MVSQKISAKRKTKTIIKSQMTQLCSYTILNIELNSNNKQHAVGNA